MLFNSLAFASFFLLVYSTYLLLHRHYKSQNLLLLISSYVFYGYIDTWLVSLLAIATIVNFLAGKFIHASINRKTRLFLLIFAVVSNLSILGFFKYFNFFADNIVRIANLFGFQIDYVTLEIILPIGISFYTFQAMGYTIDIFRGKLHPTRSLVDFALFVSFFPQLVAGPIERAKNLLPQIGKPRSLKAEQIDAGITLIIWGFFKKMVIADNLGLISNQIFNGYTQYEGIDLLIGMFAFTVQIYCDFSAYSDIARGLCKLMGFEIMLNFKLPYFSRNPRDFWSRWHISLSTWLRDYLYIPMGGNRNGRLNTYRNLNITMLLGGLWHGAAWNYVIWGAYHGMLMTVYRLLGKDKEDANTAVSRGSYRTIIPSMIIMFILTIIGWTIFRSTSLEQICYMFRNLGFSLSENSQIFGYDLLFFSAPLIIVQFLQYISKDLLILNKPRLWFRIPIYSFLLTWIVIFGVRESMQFIYFKF